MKNKQTQPDIQPPLTGKGQFSKTLLFFCAVIIVFTTVMISTADMSVSVGQTSELSGFDYSSNIACISPECFDVYPQALYTPDDFTGGFVTHQSPDEDDGSAGYYTYRLTMELTQGRVYGLSGYSATYAQKVWVDGVLLSSVGEPGGSLETTTPKTNYYTVYFTAGSGQTEIVIQRSGFVHANGGQLFPQYLGEQPLISKMNDGIKFRGAVMAGSMLMAALFFFGIFLFFRQRRQFLYFPLSCLLITIRTLSVDHKLIMTLFPDLNWQLSLRLEYLSTIGFYIFFFMYVNLMFKRGMNKKVNICGLILGYSYFLFVLFTPAVIYTQILTYMHIGALIYTLTTVFLLVRGMVKDRENRLPEHYLILFGIIGYTALQLSDLIRYSVNNLNQDLNLTQMGVMVFVFANTLALALNFTYTERSLAEARQRERETAAENALLEQKAQMREEMVHNLSHEVRTPLAVISTYAQIAVRQYRQGQIDDQFIDGLDVINEEAGRIAELASNTLKPKEQEVRATDIAEIAQQLVRLLSPMARNTGQKMTASFNKRLMTLCNVGEITQVIWNLLDNALKHSGKGDIEVDGNENEEYVYIIVTDYGAGIPPEILPKIFERGVSDNGGSGLGLAISNEIVQRHGGRLVIESEYGMGTVATLLLPAYTCKEGE